MLSGNSYKIGGIKKLKNYQKCDKKDEKSLQKDSYNDIKGVVKSVVRENVSVDENLLIYMTKTKEKDKRLSPSIKEGGGEWSAW